MAQNEWNILDFEKPINELDSQIAEIKRLTTERGEDREADIQGLEADRDKLLNEIFANLSPWDRVLLARHPKRPYTMDYVRMIFDDYVEIHGDRNFADDPAMIGGFGTIDGKQYMFVGQQKGRDLKDRQYRNFGSAKPEGYRKALRLMKLAEKFKRPVICFVDTPAADCSVGAEQRGISEAIARNLKEMSVLGVPTVSVILGEGGSGGALGIAVTDKVLMLEHSVYSVIPPESCAAILWRDPSKNKEMAEALKITSQDVLKLKIIDEIIKEPNGGAHRNPDQTAKALKEALVTNIEKLSKQKVDKLIEKRYERYRNIGVFEEQAAKSVEAETEK